MTRRQREREDPGLTVVEVLVALAVLSLNLAGAAGPLLLAIDLMGRVAAIAMEIEEGMALASCAAALIAPRRSLRRPRPSAWARGSPRRAAGCRAVAGMTLLELVIALAIASVVALVAIGLLRSTTRTTGAIAERSVVLEARIAIPAIVSALVSQAGAGVPAATCAIGVSTDSSTLVLVRAEDDGSLRTDELFAAVDGGGRPALYHRHRPYARQPWLEDVTSFRVAPVFEAADGRVDRIELRLYHEGASREIAVSVVLPHRPCMGAS